MRTTARERLWKVTVGSDPESHHARSKIERDLSVRLPCRYCSRCQRDRSRRPRAAVIHRRSPGRRGPPSDRDLLGEQLEVAPLSRAAVASPSTCTVTGTAVGRPSLVLTVTGIGRITLPPDSGNEWFGAPTPRSPPGRVGRRWVRTGRRRPRLRLAGRRRRPGCRRGSRRRNRSRRRAGAAATEDGDRQVGGGGVEKIGGPFAAVGETGADDDLRSSARAVEAHGDPNWAPAAASLPASSRGASRSCHAPGAWRP